MIEHSNAETGVSADEDSISLGLAGVALGQRAEAIASATRSPRAQDIRLGHDRLHFEYNGLGGYGIVSKITLVDDSVVNVTLDPELIHLCEITDPELVFRLHAPIDGEAKSMLEEICSRSRTPFQRI